MAQDLLILTAISITLCLWVMWNQKVLRVVAYFCVTIYRKYSTGGQLIRDGDGLFSSPIENSTYDGEWKNNKRHGFG